MLTDTVPFTFETDGSQTVRLPQFDPALGTLIAASATLSGLVQPLLEIFNTGRSQVALSLQELLILGTLPARTSFSFGGFIPDHTPVDGVQFPPMPISISTSLDGRLAEFTGTGALPFTLTLASPANPPGRPDHHRDQQLGLGERRDHARLHLHAGGACARTDTRRGVRARFARRARCPAGGTGSRDPARPGAPFPATLR